MTMLISPYKGILVDLMVPPADRAAMLAYAGSLPSVTLTRREVCDLELLATGAFSPLRGFLGEADYRSVLDNMRLSDGTVFPVPITISADSADGLQTGKDIALRDARNDVLAVMTLAEVFEWDRERFARSVLGTADPRHPLVSEMQEWGRFHLSGELHVLRLPEYHDFRDLRLTPDQTRESLKALGRNDVVAFQTRNPMHRAHEVITQKAIRSVDGTLLLHPAVGMTRDGDIDYFTRVRTYRAAAAAAYPPDRVLLSLLPLAMRMAGPREAVWHAIIRRNYGAGYFIVGRDHASPGSDASGKPFYEPFAAQELAQQFSSEIGVKILAFGEFTYLPGEGRYREAGSSTGATVSLSGTALRDDFLRAGRELPQWFVRKEVASILAAAHPPKHRRGVCLWFTGLSGSGKSTTAAIVATLLLEEGRQATVLDGDVVRTHLSKGLGFSKDDRDTNIRRIGFVASEIVRHGGIAICAAISPYRQSRNHVRSMFADDAFIEIFVDTPIEVCEQRDAKGLYAAARRGEIRDFTGVDDVYETPEAPELTIETANATARENAVLIIEDLRSRGYLLDHAADALRPCP